MATGWVERAYKFLTSNRESEIYRFNYQYYLDNDERHIIDSFINDFESGQGWDGSFLNSYAVTHGASFTRARVENMRTTALAKLGYEWNNMEASARVIFERTNKDRRRFSEMLLRATGVKLEMDQTTALQAFREQLSSKLGVDSLPMLDTALEQILASNTTDAKRTFANYVSQVEKAAHQSTQDMQASLQQIEENQKLQQDIDLLRSLDKFNPAREKVQTAQTTVRELFEAQVVRKTNIMAQLNEVYGEISTDKPIEFYTKMLEACLEDISQAAIEKDVKTVLTSQQELGMLDQKIKELQLLCARRDRLQTEMNEIMHNMDRLIQSRHLVDELSQMFDLVSSTITDNLLSGNISEWLEELRSLQASRVEASAITSIASIAA